MSWIRDFVSGRRPAAGDAAGGTPAAPPSLREVQIATAVLLLEVSAADHEVDERERQAIVSGIETAFALDPQETAEVFEIAGRRSRKAVSLYEFTRSVDRSFSREQKAVVIELLFRVAFADEQLAGEEEHLIRKVATLLHVEHPAYLAAKLRAGSAPGGSAS